jgi:hypothetical protein
MKNKAISAKIRTTLRLIEDYKKNEIVFGSEKTKMQFEDLMKDYETAAALKSEIDLLKQELKSKEKEIGKRIKKLSKSRKIAKKVLKKSSKASHKAVLIAPKEKKAVVTKIPTVRKLKSTPQKAIKKTTKEPAKV